MQVVWLDRKQRTDNSGILAFDIRDSKLMGFSLPVRNKQALLRAVDRRMKEHVRQYPKMVFSQAHLNALREWFLADEGNKHLRADLTAALGRNQYVEHRIRILIKWAQDIFGQRAEKRGAAQIKEYMTVVKQIDKTINEDGNG